MRVESATKRRDPTVGAAFSTSTVSERSLQPQIESLSSNSGGKSGGLGNQRIHTLLSADCTLSPMPSFTFFTFLVGPPSDHAISTQRSTGAPLRPADPRARLFEMTIPL
jgi:hypothetical protein